MCDHTYILKTQAVAICTHCDRALDTPDVLHRINAYGCLLSALDFAMSELSDMTTEQFSNGADKQARERMTEAIRKAKENR